MKTSQCGHNNVAEKDWRRGVSEKGIATAIERETSIKGSTTQWISNDYDVRIMTIMSLYKFISLWCAPRLFALDGMLQHICTTLFMLRIRHGLCGVCCKQPCLYARQLDSPANKHRWEQHISTMPCQCVCVCVQEHYCGYAHYVVNVLWRWKKVNCVC